MKNQNVVDAFSEIIKAQPEEVFTQQAKEQLLLAPLSWVRTFRNAFEATQTDEGEGKNFYDI